jgi:Uma2 family endonuclease
MSTLIKPKAAAIEYPDCDGEPMADNTLQYEWIVTIKGGLDAMYKDDADVFVAGDLLWYPVEGDNKTRTAPDALVVFGRPKGYRGSYRQWEEGGIAPQVVFEVLSPGNRLGKMLKKLRFYERFDVEEYYVYDPEGAELTGFLRSGDKLQEIETLENWRSPRLGVRFVIEEGELRIYRPDGRRFLTFLEMEESRELAEAEASTARAEAAAAQTRADRLAAQLPALGVEPQG